MFTHDCWLWIIRLDTDHRHNGDRLVMRFLWHPNPFSALHEGQWKAAVCHRAEAGFSASDLLPLRHPDDPCLVESDDHAETARLRAAVDGGDPEARCLLADKYIKGEGVERNLTVAIELLVRARAGGGLSDRLDAWARVTLHRVVHQQYASEQSPVSVSDMVVLTARAAMGN